MDIMDVTGGTDLVQLVDFKLILAAIVLISVALTIFLTAAIARKRKKMKMDVSDFFV